jgi:hypothetical protein
MNLTKYNHTDFSIDELLHLKGGRKILVVFSTFGEREADLVCEKITLLETLPAGLSTGLYLTTDVRDQNLTALKQVSLPSTAEWI